MIFHVGITLAWHYLSCAIRDKRVEMSKQDNRGKLEFFLLVFLWNR